MVSVKLLQRTMFFARRINPETKKRSHLRQLESFGDTVTLSATD